MRTERVDARALSLSELEEFVLSLDEPRYRARQLFRWMHQRGVRTFEEMSDLPKRLRAGLEARADLFTLEIARVERSIDGTRKYALRTARGDVVEAVFIPDASSAGRNTLCISSQVGCAIDCKFCLTASLGLIRNLTAGEIAGQIARVREDLQTTAPGDSVIRNVAISNIVLMGMGEPLQNYGALIDAIHIMTSMDGYAISPRRITVSTAGLAPRIPRLGHDVKVNLAVSLNATTDEVRDRIMPINKKWNIANLLDACREFPLPERRRITFEYVLLKDVNDTDLDARRLVKLLRGLRAKVNLIPFNPHPYSAFSRSPPERVQRFQGILGDLGLTALVRTPRGEDISAACGQLGVEVDAPRRRLTILP